MKQRTINSKRATSAIARCSLAALAATFAACSADTLVMGENTTELTPLPPDSRCRESTTLSGDLLVENALLENIDSTSGLERAGRIVVIENPNLTHLPDYLQLVGLSELWINDNDRLVTWPQFADLFMGDIGAPISPFIRRMRTIEIMGNAALTSVELPAAWANGTTVNIGDNAALTQVAFPTLAYLETLIIDNNPSLTSVEFGGFDRAFALEVRDNPLLDDSIFATVRSLEREIVRNAPQP